MKHLQLVGMDSHSRLRGQYLRHCSMRMLSIGSRRCWTSWRIMRKYFSHMDRQSKGSQAWKRLQLASCFRRRWYLWRKGSRTSVRRHTSLCYCLQIMSGSGRDCCMWTISSRVSNLRGRNYSLRWWIKPRFEFSSQCVQCSRNMSSIWMWFLRICMQIWLDQQGISRCGEMKRMSFDNFSKLLMGSIMLPRYGTSITTSSCLQRDLFVLVGITAFTYIRTRVFRAHCMLMTY